jgi:hypothetical protein
MKDLSAHIEKKLKPFREIQQIAEPFRGMQEAMEPLRQFQKTFENINKIYFSLPKIENPFQEHLETFQKIGERLKQYAEQTPGYLLLIAEHGWFIEFNSELSFPADIGAELENKNIEGANNLLIDYYSNNLERIFRTLIERHKNRTDIINELILNFKNKNYYTFIPTIFSQIDGICFDFTTKQFFIKERKTWLPQVTAELKKNTGSFLNLYLSPLQNQTPIIAREEDLYRFPCKLNRHEIIHGVNTSYGTYTNSLKVLSLFKYISDLLMRMEQ